MLGTTKKGMRVQYTGDTRESMRGKVGKVLRGGKYRSTVDFGRVNYSDFSRYRANNTNLSLFTGEIEIIHTDIS